MDEFLRLIHPDVSEEKANEKSEYTSYDELPLFLNSELVAKVLGASPLGGYEPMYEPSFPVLRVGSRMVVPKEKFIQWVEEHTGGKQ